MGWTILVLYGKSRFSACTQWWLVCTPFFSFHILDPKLAIDSRNCCRRLVKALWILPRPPSLGARSGIPKIPCNWCGTFTLPKCSFLKILKTQTWEHPTCRWVKSHWFEGEIHIFHDGWTKPYSSWPSLNVIMIILVEQFLIYIFFLWAFWWFLYFQPFIAGEIISHCLSIAAGWLIPLHPKQCFDIIFLPIK